MLKNPKIRLHLPWKGHQSLQILLWFKTFPWEPTKAGEKRLGGSQMPLFCFDAFRHRNESLIQKKNRWLMTGSGNFMVCDMKSPYNWVLGSIIPYAYIKLHTSWFRNSWFRPQMFAHWFRMEFSMRFYLESSTPQQLHHTKEKMQFPKPLVNPTAVYMPCTYFWNKKLCRPLVENSCMLCLLFTTF